MIELLAVALLALVPAESAIERAVGDMGWIFATRALPGRNGVAENDEPSAGPSARRSSRAH
jgi:hypothetical protein